MSPATPRDLAQAAPSLAARLDDVLEKDQLETVLDLIRRHGPWDLITEAPLQLPESWLRPRRAAPLDPNASLDFLTPTFRGFFANGGVCLSGGGADLLRPALHGLGARVLNARYCQPMKILFNVNGPAWNSDQATSTRRASAAWAS
jgi:hypothetical protein